MKKPSGNVSRTAGERFVSDPELASDMDPALVVGGVIGEINSSMKRLKAICDAELISKAADIIRKARLVYIFGAGASALAAQDLYQKLIRIGFPCTNTVDARLQITSACSLKKGDAAFIVSCSGEIQEMISCARIARKKGASIITLTTETENTLGALADAALRVPFRERIGRTGSAAVSLINQIAVNDMIYFMLISKNPEQAMRALNETTAAAHYQEGENSAGFGGLH